MEAPLWSKLWVMEPNIRLCKETLLTLLSNVPNGIAWVGSLFVFQINENCTFTCAHLQSMKISHLKQIIIGDNLQLSLKAELQGLSMGSLSMALSSGLSVHRFEYLQMLRWWLQRTFHTLLETLALVTYNHVWRCSCTASCASAHTYALYMIRNQWW